MSAHVATAERRLTAWAVPVGTLGLVAAACWAVTVQRMQGMDMGPGTNLGSLGWFAAVWITMMAAMMLPSLSPMAVAVAAGGRRIGSVARTAAFATAYLLPWAAYGAIAYGLVEGTRSLDPGVGLLEWGRGGRYAAGGVILAATLYELTAAKSTCLRRCRDARLLRRRRGVVGAALMGVEQGAFCVGCSGALMAALFALGVMSLAWMLLIAALVALEKLLPWQLAATGATAALLGVLGVAVVVVPDRVPWLTVPIAM
jgi:predicted metal-binding membrane protein